MEEMMLKIQEVILKGTEGKAPYELMSLSSLMDAVIFTMRSVGMNPTEELMKLNGDINEAIQEFYDVIKEEEEENNRLLEELMKSEENPEDLPF
jgi:hypothetical protein